MENLSWQIEIKISIPFGDLITYPNEDSDKFIENNKLKSIRDYLKINIDILDWVYRIEKILEGNKKLCQIELHYSKDEDSYILLDNYLDPYDQLDIITIGFKTTAKKARKLRKLARLFNDDSIYNIDYREGAYSLFKNYPIDEKSKNKFLKPLISNYLNGKKIIINKPNRLHKILKIQNKFNNNKLILYIKTIKRRRNVIARIKKEKEENYTNKT